MEVLAKISRVFNLLIVEKHHLSLIPFCIMCAFIAWLLNY